MVIEEYEKILKKILGKEKYAQLCNLTFAKIEEKFKGEDIVTARKIAHTNHLAILIIGLLAGKNTEKCYAIKRLDLRNTLGSRYLVEDNFEKFTELYSEYINDIKKYNQEGDNVDR